MVYSGHDHVITKCLMKSMIGNKQQWTPFLGHMLTWPSRRQITTTTAVVYIKTCTSISALTHSAANCDTFIYRVCRKNPDLNILLAILGTTESMLAHTSLAHGEFEYILIYLYIQLSKSILLIWLRQKLIFLKITFLAGKILARSK